MRWSYLIFVCFLLLYILWILSGMSEKFLHWDCFVSRFNLCEFFGVSDCWQTQVLKKICEVLTWILLFLSSIVSGLLKEGFIILFFPLLSDMLITHFSFPYREDQF